MKFGVNSKGWTVIDCNGGFAHCAVSVKTAVRAGQRPLVLAAAELAGPADAQPDAAPDGTALRSLMAEMDRSLPVLMTLARPGYRLRVMPEPAVPLREMASSLRWALGAESDSPGEDFNLAWIRIPTDEHLPNRPKQLYAVTTPTAWLAQRLAAWRSAGVKPKVVDIRETALRNIAGTLEKPGEGVALVSVDSDGVAMVFTHQGALYLDRFIDQPLAELQGADAATKLRLHERIALQLLRSIDVIGRSYPFMPITRVVVAPAPQGFGLLEFLSAQVPFRVEPLRLDQVFDLSQVPALAQSDALQARCLVPLGAALRSARALA